MIAVTGNWATGMIDQRFIIQTKKNSETTRGGTYFSPSRLPIVSWTMPRRMKSYPVSATICSLPGTTFGLRKAAQKKPTMTIEPSRASSIGLLKYRLLSASPQRGLEQERVQAGCRETTTVEDVAIGLEGEHLCRVSTHRGLLQRGA